MRAQVARVDTSQLRRALATQDVLLESVIGIQRSARFVIVDTHINPSAGRIVVLTDRLEPVTTLAGWTLRVLPDETILYHRNGVHFAPTHWAELWTWNAATRRDTRIYPNAPWDSVRRAYIDTVRAIYDRAGADWFRVHNHHMDAQRFASRVGDTIVVARSGRTLAFPVTFGGGEGTSAATPALEVVVVCREVGTERAQCREQPLAALTRAQSGSSTLEILNGLIEACCHSSPPRALRARSARNDSRPLPAQQPVLTIERARY